MTDHQNSPLTEHRPENEHSKCQLCNGSEQVPVFEWWGGEAEQIGWEDCPDCEARKEFEGGAE